MGRIIVVCLLLASLSACTVIAAVGGAAVDGAMYVFTAEKKSLPFSMRTILVASQKTLDQMALSANIIEPTDDGYRLEFTNKKLSGSIYLRAETARLTTISGRVYKGISREKSVEHAIFSGIQKKAPNIHSNERFDFTAYHYIREEASVHSAKVGWFIPGSKLKVSPSNQTGWLKVTLPSGKKAFLKGSMGK